MTAVRIDLRGPLDEALAHRIVRAIRAAAVRSVDLRIDSEGGSLAAAIAICLEIEEHSHPIFTTVHAKANSAASLIAASGDLRRIDRRGLILVHCPSPPSPDAAAEVRAALVEYSRQLPRDVAEWMAREKTFTAGEALQAGLVDRIIDAAAPEPVRLWTPAKRRPTQWLRPWRVLFEEFDLRLDALTVRA